MRRFIQGSRLCCSVAYKISSDSPTAGAGRSYATITSFDSQISGPKATYRNRTRQSVKVETLDIVILLNLCQAKGTLFCTDGLRFACEGHKQSFGDIYADDLASKLHVIGFFV